MDIHKIRTIIYSVTRLLVFGLTVFAVTPISIASQTHENIENIPTNKIGPPNIRSFLKNNPNSTLPFIITVDPDAPPSTLKRIRDDTDGLNLPGVRNTQLDLINGIVAELSPSTVFNLETNKNILQLWYVHEDLITTYVGILLGLQYTLTKKDNGYNIVTANISLSPPAQLMPLEMRPNEPMHKATKIAAEAGIIPIFAIGNYSDRRNTNAGIVNPWCFPEWVVCVGAANESATELWPRSAIGSAKIPSTWPDVVAWGWDTVTWTNYLSRFVTESDNAPVTENHLFVAFLDKYIYQTPRHEEEEYIKVSGTSFAVPHVAAAVTQISHYIQAYEKSLGLLEFRHIDPEGDFDTIAKEALKESKLKISYNKSHAEKLKILENKRLTGIIKKEQDGGVTITYPIQPRWKTIKQILVDLALPMEGYGPHEVGGGFVYTPYYEKLLGKYGKAKPSFIEINVVD